MDAACVRETRSRVAAGWPSRNLVAVHLTVHRERTGRSAESLGRPRRALHRTFLKPPRELGHNVPGAVLRDSGRSATSLDAPTD